MAGGIGSRKKRPSSSSSSGSSPCFSVVTGVIFLAFCILGVWIFTSSSVVTTRLAQSGRTSVRSLTPPRGKAAPAPPTFDDNPGDLPDDAIKEDLGRAEDKQDFEGAQVEGEQSVGGEKQEEATGEEEAVKEEVSEVVVKEEVSEEAAKGDEERQKTEKLIGEEEEQPEKGKTAAAEEDEKQNVLEQGRTDAAEDDVKTEEGAKVEENSESRQLEDNPENPSGGGGGGAEEEGGGGVRKESSYSSSQGDEATAKGEGGGGGGGGEIESSAGRNWELCNTTAGPDYIPCLDNEEALKKVQRTGHYEHRERHCPTEGPACLVPLPKGYRRSIEWPRSREKIWYNNVPHTKLAEVKGHQNWVKVEGEYLNFPGGGTQFIHGALHYIDFIQKAVPRIAWGKHTRVILDVGCGVASFGGFLFEKDVLAMSFAPKDEHEAQVQFALERGIPAISAVMGTQRLPFPARVFDIVHCARCRVPWHVEGGRLLLELNRVLRPGGYFVWSATPVYQKLKEDVEIWKAMSELTASMCWDLVTIKKDRINSIGAAIFRKPVTNDCYNKRKDQTPPMCAEEDDASASWYVPLQSCMHRVPIHSSERGTQWPVDWPQRLETPPYWLNSSGVGVYGKPAMEDFSADHKHWKEVVEKSYIKAMGISWSKIRNVMDMKAVYGGFAAALKDLNVWVMNVVNTDTHDTLPLIYERGLFGLYHDWCESFSTYPRTYDLLHADHLFSGIKKRCDILPLVVEVDRIVRPGGTFILRDDAATTGEVENLLKSLHWDVRMTFSQGQEGILCAEKTDWRPETSTSSS